MDKRRRGRRQKGGKELRNLGDGGFAGSLQTRKSLGSKVETSDARSAYLTSEHKKDTAQMH